MTSRRAGTRGAPAVDVAGIELVQVRVSPKTVWSFVRLHCTDGTAGVGEASLMRDAESLDAPLQHARARLERAPLAHVLDFVDNEPRDGIAQAAIASALEQAATDVEARHAELPAWSLVDGNGARDIPLYANINRRTVDRSPAGFRASASEAVAAGFGAFKIAPFDDLTPAIASSPEGSDLTHRGLARAAAVREAIGPERELYIDCHWRFSPASAVHAIEALAELGVTWFECPLPERADTMPAIAVLRRRANAHGMRLAGLEELTSAEAFGPWLQAGAYDVVMPDVKYCGGIAELIAVAAQARRHGIACAPHNPTGPVCHAASLAACSAMRDPVLLEHQWDETPAFFAMAGGALPRPANGTSPLPQTPGLGVTLDFGSLDVRVC